MVPSRITDLGATVLNPNGTAPRCEHLDGLAAVTPQSDHCQECGIAANLLVCLGCGWVACSDESPGRHARAHYEETDHPLVATLETGSPWRWCYVHRRLV